MYREMTRWCTAAIIVFTATSANAGLISKGFSWEGEFGYSATGTLVYDDAFSTVTADGSSVHGLNYLDVTFFDPFNGNEIQTVANVVDGVSNYSYLDVTFDTAAMAFTDTIDVGFDNGFTQGNWWLAGTVGGESFLYTRGFIRQFRVDATTNTSIAVFDVPAPGPFSLMLLGVAALGFSRRDRAIHRSRHRCD